MKNLLVGIDIGTSETRIMVTEPSSQKDGVRIVGVGTAQTRGMRHGYVMNPDDVVRSLQKARHEAEQQAKCEIDSVYLALQGVSLASHIVSAKMPISSGDGEIKENDLDRIADQALDRLSKKVKNIRIVHALPLEYALDGEHVLGRPLGMRGSVLEVQMLFVTILDHHYEMFIDVVDRAGMDVTDCVAGPVALASITLPRRNKVVGTLLLSIGSETTSMAIFEEDTLIDLSVITIGSHDITNDLALGFKVDLDTAERIKQEPGYQDTPKRLREEIIRARLDDIFELVVKRLKKINRHELLPAGALIIGGGSHIEGVDEYAQEALSIPITLLNNTALTHIFRSKKYVDEKFLTAYGLCHIAHKQYGRGHGSWIKNITSSISRFFANIVEQFLP